MPVQTKNKRRDSHGSKKTKSLNLPNWLRFIIYIPVSFLVVFILYVIISPSKYWDGKTRLALAINTKEGNIAVSVFDPQTNSINTIIIPQNTQMDVARQLGTWKAGSIWKLSQNEKLSGKLLSETVTKSLKLPTESWADTPAIGFSKSDSISVLRALIGSYRTNLTIKDRIGLAMFSLSVKNSERSETDLSQTPLLVRARLTDGSLGYEVRETAVDRISAIFADTKISEENLSIAILYPQDRIVTAQHLGEIVQVLGTKVTSLEVNSDTKLDCIVSGKNSLTRKKIADVFNCTTENKDLGSTLEIKIGDSFIKRF